MSRACAWAMALAAALLLGGCVSAPMRAPVAVDPVAAGQADARRAAMQDWSLAGRVAVSGGRQGGSGRLDWTQRGDRYDLVLSAPVTRQGWRLVGDAGRARLEGIEGGPREGADAGALLRQATGWDIPVRALVDWVRGVPAPEPVHGPARMVHGAGDLPARLEQAGWAIEYRDWFEADGDRPALPRRIEATRGDARVRLVVDDWTSLAAAPPQAEAAAAPEAAAAGKTVSGAPSALPLPGEPAAAGQPAGEPLPVRRDAPATGIPARAASGGDGS